MVIAITMPTKIIDECAASKHARYRLKPPYPRDSPKSYNAATSALIQPIYRNQPRIIEYLSPPADGGGQQNDHHLKYRIIAPQKNITSLNSTISVHKNRSR